MAKKTDYFKLLQEQMEYVKKAADKLKDVLTNFDPEKLDESREELHIIERLADNKSHDIEHQLAMEFITPIERDDLAVMVKAIDDIVDCIDDILIRVYMYNMKSITPSVVRFAQLISSAADTLQEIAAEFANFRKSKTIKDLIIKINYFEEEGDAIYQDSIASLFRDPKATSIDIIVWSNIYEALEMTCDSFEELCNLFERVIMNNT